MKRILILLILLTIVGCKDTPKPDKTKSKVIEVLAKKTKKYPENVKAVFDAHGGLKTWQAMRTLSFTMAKQDGNETHTTDLITRSEKIETPNFAMGYDGIEFWLADENKFYEGDPIFYHNLMFYFYAMPFVLADEGIVYSETENLEFEGKSYPGIRISYNDGVGVSPKDEYFLHYDAETKQMAWLGYTVTYKSGKKSENIKWIRYTDWQELNALVLPKSLTWHKVENGKPLGAASTRNFDAVIVSDKAKPASFYATPENATIVSQD